MNRSSNAFDGVTDIFLDFSREDEFKWLGRWSELGLNIGDFSLSGVLLLK
jgi:hypothetical protein